jgi:hypothetical protein
VNGRLRFPRSQLGRRKSRLRAAVTHAAILTADEKAQAESARGSIDVSGGVDFVEGLIAQPEIRRALNGAVVFTFPT